MAIVSVLPQAERFERQQILHIRDMVNAVYEVAESGMWIADVQRIREREIAQLLQLRRLIVAMDGDAIVGCVSVRELRPRLGEFGMLVASPDRRGEGIGTLLVEAAEQWARERGYLQMRLELLTPRTWRHPMKEFLKEWYSRMDYVPQETESFAAMYPERMLLLATECDFTPWMKQL